LNRAEGYGAKPFLFFLRSHKTFDETLDQISFSPSTKGIGTGFCQDVQPIGIDIGDERKPMGLEPMQQSIEPYSGALGSGY
jgi:hypothetical protein